MNVNKDIMNTLTRTITIRLMPKQKAVENELIYHSIGDMAMTYASYFEEFQIAVGIRIGMLERWGMTIKELDEIAAEYAPKNRPYRMRKVRDVILNKITKELVLEDPELMQTISEMEEEKDKELWILDYEDDCVNGAAAICYREAREQIGKALGDVWIIPSSRHEVLLIKDHGENPGELEQIIMSVNTEVIDPKDKLSDLAYHLHVGDSQIETGYRWIGRRA